MNDYEDSKTTGGKRARELQELAMEALFLLNRVTWEMSEGAALTGGEVTAETHDRAVELLKKAGV